MFRKCLIIKIDRISRYCSNVVVYIRTSAMAVKLVLPVLPPFPDSVTHPGKVHGLVIIGACRHRCTYTPRVNYEAMINVRTVSTGCK